jgi:hypothetical protein
MSSTNRMLCRFEQRTCTKSAIWRATISQPAQWMFFLLWYFKQKILCPRLKRGTAHLKCLSRQSTCKDTLPFVRLDRTENPSCFGVWWTVVHRINFTEQLRSIFFAVCLWLLVVICGGNRSWFVRDSNWTQRSILCRHDERVILTCVGLEYLRQLLWLLYVSKISTGRDFVMSSPIVFTQLSTYRICRKVTNFWWFASASISH